jgi:hypothetical protein
MRTCSTGFAFAKRKADIASTTSRWSWTTNFYFLRILSPMIVSGHAPIDRSYPLTHKFRLQMIGSSRQVQCIQAVSHKRRLPAKKVFAAAELLPAGE